MGWPQGKLLESLLKLQSSSAQVSIKTDLQRGCGCEFSSSPKGDQVP